MATLKYFNEETQAWEIVTVGEDGAKGDKGDNGAGFPAGGTTGQIVVRDTTLPAGGKWVDKVFTATTDFGPTVDIATINAAIAAVPRGTVVIPPGTYSFSGDILINAKNNGTGSTGFFTLDATGVRLTGTGNIIINSCKRIKIIGLDAPNYDMLWRGCWTSTFDNMRYRKLIMGDATGTSYSSAAWNQITGGSSQGARIHENATSYYNVISWEDHIINGSASQGFAQTADYAFEFNGDVGAQDWVFEKGDISYQNIDTYIIGAGNLTGGIELTFRDTYFDSLVYPKLTDYKGCKIRIDNCHHANAHGFSSSVPAALSGGSVDFHRSDKSIKHNGSIPVNFIKNGDFKDILSTWVGTDHPISAFASGTVTAKPGGLSGTYLTLSSQTTPSNTCYFQSAPTPFAARLTGTIIIRNGEPGTRDIRIGISGQYVTKTISDTEWTVVTATNNTLAAAGSQKNILVYMEDNTPYIVDVAYVGMTLGNGNNITSEDIGRRSVYHSFTYNPGTIAAGAVAQTTVTLANTTRGDFVEVTANQALSTVKASGHVDTDGSVVVTLQNIGSSSVALASSTWYIKVNKRTY